MCLRVVSGGVALAAWIGALIGRICELWESCVTVTRAVRALLRPSLVDIVSAARRDLISKNGSIRRYRYGRIRRAFLYAASHPFSAIAAIAGVYIGVAVLVLGIDLSAITHPRIDDYYRDFFNAIVAMLAAQAALVAIVYPLIVASAGVLFDVRAGARTRLEIFLKETEAVSTGGSGLILIAAMAIQLPFIGLLPVRCAAAVAGLDVLWFVVNVVGAAFFLSHSIAYLRPEMRPVLFRRYVANVVWPTQFSELYALSQSLGAVDYGYLPKYASIQTNPNDNGDDTGAESTVPAVYMHPLLDYGVPEVTIGLPKSRCLSDIRLSLLELVVREWFSKIKNEHERRNRLSNDRAFLAFQVSVGETYSGQVVLVRRSGEPALSWAQRLAIRLAFVFRRDKRGPSASSTQSLLKEAVAELLPLMDQQRVAAFEAQAKEIIDLHIFLYEIAGDRTGSYAIMGDPNRMLALEEDWARQYREVFGRATDLLSREADFFRTCAYLPAGLLRRGLKHAPPDALKSVAKLATKLHFHLREWAGTTYKAESGRFGAPDVVAELKADTSSIHGEALRVFIAGWESLAAALFEGQRKEALSWLDLTVKSRPVITHLQDTATMVASFAAVGDLQGARWLVDALLKWYGINRYSWSDVPDREWIFGTSFLTSDLFGLTWEEARQRPLHSQFEQKFSPSALFDATCKNVWEDVCLTLASVLLSWASEKPQSVGAAILGARALVRHETMSDDAHTDGERPFSSPVEVLQGIIRMIASGERIATHYRAAIDSLIERFREKREAPWISQRVYLRVGGGDVGGLATEQALLLMGIGPTTRDVPEQIRTALHWLVSQDDDAVRRVQNHISNLHSAAEGILFERYGVLFAQLRGVTPEDATAFQQAKEATSAFVKNVGDVLTQERETRIKEVDVDPKRLEEICRAASALAFQRPTSSFPISLFETVDSTPQPLEECALVTERDKGEFTTPRMAVVAANEVEWLGKTVRNHVAARVLGDVLDKASMRNVEAFDAETYWLELEAASKRIERGGGVPLLIIGPVTDPAWLYDHVFDRGRAQHVPPPPTLKMHKEKHRGDSYVIDLGPVRVYRGPIGRGVSYIIPDRMLWKLEFTRPPGVDFVQARFEPGENPLRGKLKLKWARRVTLREGEICRLKFAETKP